MKFSFKEIITDTASISFLFPFNMTYKDLSSFPSIKLKKGNYKIICKIKELEYEETFYLKVIKKEEVLYIGESGHMIKQNCMRKFFFDYENGNLLNQRGFSCNLGYDGCFNLDVDVKKISKLPKDEMQLLIKNAKKDYEKFLKIKSTPLKDRNVQDALNTNKEQTKQIKEFKDKFVKNKKYSYFIENLYKKMELKQSQMMLQSTRKILKDYDVKIDL